jgi:hypothetical protein
MPGVARVDHRTKCVFLVAISLSQNFESSNNPRSKQRNIPSERTPKKIPPRNGPQRKCRYQETDLELTKKKTPPLHSNSPPSPRNTHTNKVSPFRFYIYRYSCALLVFSTWLHKIQTFQILLLLPASKIPR